MSRLPPGYQYSGRDILGGRACERRMRQRFRIVERMTDQASRAAMTRLRAACADEPEEADSVRHLALSALEAAEGVRCTWAEAIVHLLDKFDERAQEDAA